MLEPRRPERLVLAQDRALELPQSRTGLDAEFVDEVPTRLAVGPQGIRLTAGSVLGEHQLLGEALAQRMRGVQRLELRDDRTLVAKLEGEIVAVLDRLEPPLLQAAPLGAQHVVG